MASSKNDDDKNRGPGSWKQEEEKEEQYVVVMVPLPAQGHLNQLLQLSCLISSYGLPVHYVGSAVHNRQAIVRANGLDPALIAKIQFHDLPTPDFSSPDPNTSSNFPAHLVPLWNSTVGLREPVADILRELASTATRMIVIHDPLMSAVVQDLASIPNAESYIITCISAFAIFFMSHAPRGKPVVDAVPKGLPSTTEECLTPEILRFIGFQTQYMKGYAGQIHNTSRAIEGTYCDLLTNPDSNRDKKQWTLGPLLYPVRSTPGMELGSSRLECLKWLNEQPSNSVVFVSFGTTTSMSDEGIKELAIGLEQSEQRFIWVLRDADKGDVFGRGNRTIGLPEGFEDRVQGRGLIIRDWAPQPEILAHPSTGGFVSHCGWNSCIESITAGVPIGTWPMHSDQPWNAVLITEVLKIGVVVREWAQREKPVSSWTVANSLKRLMASREGDEMKKRAAELADAVRRSTEEGGSSRLELDSFISHITR